MEEDLFDQLQDQVPYQVTHRLTPRVSQLQQLHLRYTYSGMSNTSSCNDFMLNTARSFNQENSVKFNFVQSQKLFESITKIVDQLQQKMNIHKDLIIYLLFKYKWNAQRLQEIYYDQDVMKFKQMNEKIHKNNVKEYNFQKQKCQICCEQRQLYHSFFCNHQYCKKCWEYYIQQNLTNNKIFFTCMNFQCHQSPIILEFVRKVAPNFYQNYLKKICINYSITNKTISYCPSDSCNYFCQKLPTIQQNYIECLCGTKYCFKCQNQPHQPAFCNEVQIWQKLTNRQKNNQNWIEKYTKKCPQCKQNVQKYVGCNHVKCICGCEFCFNCTFLWNQFHKNNPEHCLSKRSSLISQKDHKLQKQKQFTQILDKVIFISRSMKKDTLTIKKTQDLINESENLCYLKDILSDLNSEVFNAWANVKWSLISLFIRKCKSIEIELEKDAVEQIKSIIQTVEKIQHKISKNFLKINNNHEFINLKEQLVGQKDKMFKNIEVFSQAWKHQAEINIE